MQGFLIRFRRPRGQCCGQCVSRNKLSRYPLPGPPPDPRTHRPMDQSTPSTPPSRLSFRRHPSAPICPIVATIVTALAGPEIFRRSKRNPINQGLFDGREVHEGSGPHGDLFANPATAVPTLCTTRSLSAAFASAWPTCSRQQTGLMMTMHRHVETNGIRVHFAEQDDGPLVLLCHGFPKSWYSWRHQPSRARKSLYRHCTS